MKKLFLIVLILGGCKKENTNIIYPAGTLFNLKNISLSSIAQVHNGVNLTPENPFTIDALWTESIDTGLLYYVCHSANGNQYKMPENNMQIISIPTATPEIKLQTK